MTSLNLFNENFSVFQIIKIIFQSLYTEFKWFVKIVHLFFLLLPSPDCYEGGTKPNQTRCEERSASLRGERLPTQGLHLELRGAPTGRGRPSINYSVFGLLKDTINIHEKKVPEEVTKRKCFKTRAVSNKLQSSSRDSWCVKVISICQILRFILGNDSK